MVVAACYPVSRPHGRLAHALTADKVMTGFTCSTCGKYHAEMPMSFGPGAPAPWYAMPENERQRRARLTPDQCIIDDQHFFVLGCIELPVQGTSDVFSWLAWVSLSRADFQRTCDLWRTKGREAERPYFGWLCSSLPGYSQTTLGLKTNVHTRPVGERPYIKLESTEHPLSIEQRDGIPISRLQEIVERSMHATNS
jgi:hypothetical protein